MSKENQDQQDVWADFDAAYKKACETSDPKKYQHAALIAQQVRMALAAPTEPSKPEQADGVSWRCFHCGEVFVTEVDAGLHFGRYEHDKPACQFDAEHIRWMEAQHRRNVDDDSEALRTVCSLLNEHEDLRRKAEELGYARGLADAKKHPEDLGLATTPPASAAPSKPEQAEAPSEDREEIEAVIACLGDDAAQLRDENPEDERADNMDKAADLLGRLLATTPPASAAPSKLEQAEGPRWPNVETAMEDALFQRARAIMGTDNWFQDNALRNVINYILSQQNEAVSGNGESDPLTSDDVIHDASRASQESRHGKNQRDQHRGGKTGADRAHDQSTGRRDGIHGACDVSAKVDATPPASAAGEPTDLRRALERALGLLDRVYTNLLADGVMPATGLIEARKEARAALAGKPLPEQKPVEEYNGWYCAHCRRGVDGSEVTFREQHTECGRVITNDRPPAPLPEQVAQDSFTLDELADACMAAEIPDSKYETLCIELDRSARTRGEGSASHG